MTRLWRDVRSSLRTVRAPVLLMRSRHDHVVDDLTGRLIIDQVPQVSELMLENSFHVATMDNDADLIGSASREFLAGLSR